MEQKDIEVQRVEKEEERPNEDNLDKNDDREHHFIYFIESHEKSKQIEVKLSPEYKDSSTLETLDEKEINKKKISLIYKLYRFKLFPANYEENNNEVEIPIIITEIKNGEEFTSEYNIKVKDIRKDFYEYNLQMETINDIKLSYEQKFEIYVECLRKKLKIKQIAKENDEFIISSGYLLEKKYDLLFFLLIFLECFSTKIVETLLPLFQLEKIKGIGEVSEVKLRQMKNIFNVISKKPEKIKVEKEESRKEITEKFFLIYLYFNINFQKDKIAEMFNDDNIFNYLNEQLFIYQNFFDEKLILPSELVAKLINKAKDFRHILKYLYYCGGDCQNLLETINKNIKLIGEKIIEQDDNNERNEEEEDENKKEDKIDFEKYVKPKKEDNLKNIMELINQIYIYEGSENIKIIKFSPTTLEQYIEFHKNSNIENLTFINQMLIYIQKIDKKFEIKYKLDNIIHETGLNLIKNKVLKNLEILDFISTDDYYQKKEYIHPMYRKLEIFDGIDITSVDDKFFKQWNYNNFQVMFQNQFKEFSKKIASLIKEMKDFGLIFKFFKITLNNNDTPREYIKAIKERYIELFDTYSKNECPDFNSNSALLIYLIDSNNQNLKEFLEENIHKRLDIQTINEIYIILADEYNNKLSKNMISFILDFFTKNKSNSSPSSLVYLISKCKKLRKDIFSNITKYILNEKDLLTSEENDNFKFFKGLVDNKIIEKKKFQEYGITYITKAVEIITKLQVELECFEIFYSKLSVFFQSKELEEKFLNKLLYIYFLDKEKSKEVFNQLKSKTEEVKEIIDKFSIILSCFKEFYPNLRKGDITNIENIIDRLKNDVLKSFETNFKNDYNNYKQYFTEAKKRMKEKESLIFKDIYNEIKSRIKNDDKKCLEETENNFQEFRKLFKPNGIEQINKKLLELCIKSFIENQNSLQKELNNLLEIFEIRDNQNIERIYDDLFLISKKEYIYNIVQSINTFFEIIIPKKTIFQDDINKIIKSLQTNEIKELRKCNEILKNYNIDIFGKDNKYIDILINLNKRKESIKMLFEMTIQDCRNLQELSLEDDNNYLSVNDILDLEKCVEFFISLGKLDELKNKKDIEIIESIRLKTAENPDIIIYFQKYVENYTQIIALKGTLNKSEFLKYRIRELFNGAIFILSNGKNNCFECSYVQKENKNAQKILTRENIIGLKERAQLSKKITSDFKCFIDSVTKILNIYSILENISLKGYPKIITIKIILNINKVGTKKIKDSQRKEQEEDEFSINNKFYIDEEQKEKYEDIIEILKNILSELKEKQTKAYETKSLVRFIYGRQFNLLYEYFNKNKNIDISPFLKFFTNDMNKNKITDFVKTDEKDIIENNTNNCERFLTEVLNKNNLKLKDIYQNSLIRSDIKDNLHGLNTYLCQKLEKDLFQIYKYLTGNNPMAQNILLCNEEITNEEITAFLYRAIKCEFYSCFIIGGVELLKFEQKTLIMKLLDYFLIKDKDKMVSCLIILYRNKSSDIYRYLEMKNYRNILKIKSEYKNEKYEGKDIQIIKSDKSGVGKSTSIKKEIEDNKKKWIYFPLGGVFNREDIINRLKQLKIDSNCVIHLDLYDTDLITIMMDFLFSILITRFYGQNEDIFYLSKDIQIKIEIPNSFIDFIEKFPILSLFEQKELKIENLPPLIVPTNIDCDIQVVANYLKCLKEGKIDEYDLFFPNITQPEFATRKLVYKKPKRVVMTTLPATYLPPKECQDLIFNTIKEKIKQPTYYQIISFINILAVQLKKLNQNVFLNAHQLLSSGKKINYIRTIIVKSFINLTKHFTEGAFTDLLKSQETTHKSQFGEYDEGEDVDKGVNDLATNSQRVVSYEEIDPSLLFFHEGDGQLFSIITNKRPNDKEYKDLLGLKNYQALSEKDKLKSLPKYNDENFDKFKFLEELKEILDIPNPIKRGEPSERKSLEEIAGNYVFTADNFVKMVLILLRIRSNIPVIMMGETGCGKTSLIRKLSEMKNNGNANKMKILNIHAGTNDNDIIKFIKEKVLPDALKIEEENKIEREKRKKMNLLFEEEKIWVFLDEINTCKSMGLISELMCKHTCQGEPIPSNIVFIGACNPYRKRESKDKQVEKIGLDINLANKEKKFLNDKEKEELERAKRSNLVYTVNPLPHSLLNFVFNFGSLTPNDEKKYIRSIIKESLENVFSKQNRLSQQDIKLNKIKKLAGDMVISAHEFIKEISDKSAVSLREIRRFNIFYEFFYDYLYKRKKIIEKEENIINNSDKEFYTDLDDFSTQVYAINLSVFVCYYLRITNKDSRIILNDKMNKIFKNFEPTNPKLNKDFLDLPLKEEKFIADNITMDEGIAKNRALLENIFSLFVAINNKVPIFIVGKPGCSKSLSFQLLNKSMQGVSSINSFFKYYPKLLINSYQGSLASKSKDVENIFNKARTIFKKIDEKEKKYNISVIYFDEMGLAEHSPNNPLKVIHAALEYDENEGENKVAFVGISNWVLDAAKMNRGISISIPELNEEDNKETSYIIGKSYNENLADQYKLFLENLGMTYFSYKKYLKEKHNLDGKEDFHGNRDFYHLVKNAAINMNIRNTKNELNENTLLECGINSIERNFGGLQFNNEKKTSLEIIKELFKKYYPAVNITKSYDVLKRIKENIVDFNSRYLIVISKSSISTFLLSSILSQEKKDYTFYIGSKFKGDLYTEEYALKVLNQIQFHMENGNILILKGLESVYPSMYDLFNQNFTVLSNKNYARLAFGASVNTFSFVNDNFRCIVNVDLNELDTEEVPFLNRFEKHIMSFEYLLNKEQITESESIFSMLNNIAVYKEAVFKGINYDLSKLLINCNLDEIQALMYEALTKEKNDEEIKNYILSKIALTLPQDLIVNMKYGNFKQKHAKYFDKILQFYGKGEHTNFVNFLKTMNNSKNIIYTLSNPLETINNINNINHPKLGTINDKNIKRIKITSIKNENELEKHLDEFFNEDDKKICLIQFMPFEGDFMNYIRYLIQNKEKNYKNKDEKYFIFVVYMTRVLKDEIKNFDKKSDDEKAEIKKKLLEETLTNLSEYYQIFIDNLNGEDNFRIEKIIKMSIEDLFKLCINKDKDLTSNIYTSITYMKYNISEPYKGLNKDNYIKKLIEFLDKHERVRTLINECIFREIANKKDPINDMLKQKNLFFGDEIDICKMIKEYILKLYQKELSLFFFKAEKDQFFSCLLSNDIDEGMWKSENEDKTIAEKNATIYLKNLIYNDGLTRVTAKPGANNVEIILGLKLPGIKPIFDKIFKNIKDNNLAIRYRRNENNLRGYFNDKEEEEEEIRKYFRVLDSHEVSIQNIIRGEEQLLKIIELNKEKPDHIYNLIISDYFTMFLINNFYKKNIRKEGKEQEEEEKEEKEEKKIIIDYDESKKYINLIIKNRNKSKKIYKKENANEEEKDMISKLGKMILFTESYAEDIASLVEMFLELNSKIDKLYEKIEEIIEQKQIQYETSERNPEYTMLINETFFLAMDSILRVIISNDTIYEVEGQDAEDNLFELFHIYKEILQNAMKLENNLTLRSKEAFSLQEIIKLFDAFSINQNEGKKEQNEKQENKKLNPIMKEVIKYFGEETQYNILGNSKKLCELLRSFYKFLVSNFKDNKKFNYYKVLGFLFLNEFIKISFKDFRKELLKIILEDNYLIKNCSQIFKIIVENAIENSPQEMINNLSSIKEENDPLFRKVNNARNLFLDEIILNIFEGKISSFFEQIPELNKNELKELYPKYLSDNQNTKIKNLTGIVFNNSLKIFKQLINLLDDLSTKKDDEKINKDENIHLSKLYAIAYVKMYLSKVVYFIKEKNKEMGSPKEIMGIIQKIKNMKFARIVKIYVFKLFYNYMNKNFEEFKYFNYNAVGIPFAKDFDIFDIVKEEVLLTHFFLPLDTEDYSKYLEQMKKFEMIRNIRFNSATNEMAQVIGKDGLPIFLDITINKIISNLGLKNYIIDSPEYQNFSSYIKSLFNTSYKINDDIRNLLYIFYDDRKYIKEIKPKKLKDAKGTFNPQIFEMLLYGFRYCFNSLNNEKDGNYLYKHLLLKNCSEVIEKSCIPGIDTKEDLHLSSLEIIKVHFDSYKDACGCYVCDCGYYYSIEPCGFPTRNRTGKCPVCKKDIGYGPKKIPGGASNHGMIIRPGHYRIFRDIKQKVGQMSRWNDPDENIPNILLADYIKTVIEPIRKKGTLGFIKISRDFFENQNKKVRNLSNIGYRLLNFISYCHLFYAYCLDSITENKMKEFLIENMTIFQIIETDWNLLKESLQQKNVGEIKIFMNMIFKKLSKKIKECQYLSNPEERDKFEEEVNILIEECIKNYPDYSNKYNEENKKQLSIGDYDLKSIITEMAKPNEEIYPEIDYPFFKYFIFTNYKSEEDFKKRMGEKQKYPLINQLLNEVQGVNKLKNLPDFNDFTNYMVNYYSFKISRDKAKMEDLNNSEITQDNAFKKKFTLFIKSWNEIKNEAKKYKCRDEMPPKSLSINDKLIFFLNDSGELGGGMYLAAACQNFIEWQNTFLEPIITNNVFNGILHHYVDNLQKKVPVQDAKYEQIVLINDRFKSSKYINLNDIIYSFSERKVFSENGQINYSDYNLFEYDYESIEEELGKIILPGVCQFAGDDDLNFITFWSEGFRGGKTGILVKFYSKYKQQDLEDGEKEKIINYIDKLNKEKIEKYNIKYDFKEFFGSLQLLIFYLTENVTYKGKDKTLGIIKNAPSYLKLSRDCIEFFNNEGSEMTNSKLMNLFFFFEHLCFEDLAETLQPEYKMTIPEDIKAKIIDQLIKNYNNILFSIKDLGAAVRRFISRYLAGRLQTTDINEKVDLPYQLTRPELWAEKIGSDENLELEIMMKFKDIKLVVGQAFALYELIGEEDKKALSYIIDNKINEIKKK